MVEELLRAAVDKGTVPLAVVMAADGQGPTHEAAAGPATPDSLFRLASMTKIVTTVGALGLNLDRDAPVAQYVPEFAELQVLEGFDGDTPRLRPPRTQATVGQLFTHTSGLGYYFLNERLLRWRRLHGTGRDALYREPLVNDPGTRFEYGISTDWLGRVVEAASGQLLDAYLDEHVLQPLGMRDTTFRPTPEQRGRLVPVHVRKEDGAWQATEADWPQDPGWAPGGHGLYSTPRDFLRLQRHLLTQDDEIFTPRVEFPAHIATAHPRTSADLSLGPGLRWGLGGLVADPGRGGWIGLYNTSFWVDRKAGTTNALFTQTQPFAEPAVLDLAKSVGATREP